MRPPPAKRGRGTPAPSSPGAEECPAPSSPGAMGAPLPEEKPPVGLPLTQELAGALGSHWSCSIVGRSLGNAVPAPGWYMRAESGAVHHGVQTSATCGLHAVNHCLRGLGQHAVMSFDTFDGRAQADERSPSGDWEYAALQRNVEAAGGAVDPVEEADHEELTRWLVDVSRLSLWRPGVLGCIIHVPGHWVAMTVPDGPQTEDMAALICDSVYPHPFALSAEEVGDLFARIGARHQTVSLQEASRWSIYVVRRPH